MAITTIAEGKKFLDLAEANMELVRAFQYYSGIHKKPLTPRMGEPDDSIIINFARTIVDVSAAFLFGQEAPSQVVDGSPAQQDYLDLFWQANQRQVTLLKAATNGGIAGHTFIRIIPDTPFPRLVVLDPAGVTVQTNPNDISQIWGYTITPQMAEGATRTLVQTPSGQANEPVNAEGWEITDQEFQSGQWKTVASETWPYDWPPIADCQNLPKPNDYWGTADITPDVLHIIDSINRTASNTGKILRHFAHPIVYSKGMGSRQIDRSIDSIIHLPSTEASLSVLEMQSDLTSSLAFLDRLMQYLSMITRVPASAMGVPDNLGPVSGVGLKIRYAPLVQKTEQKRQLYTHMIQCIDEWVLEMAGLGTDVQTQIKWFNLIPNDDYQEAQTFGLIQGLDIMSKTTMAEKFDLDYHTELKQMAQDKKMEDKLLPKPVPPPPPTVPPTTDGTAVPTTDSNQPPSNLNNQSDAEGDSK